MRGLCWLPFLLLCGNHSDQDFKTEESRIYGFSNPVFEDKYRTIMYSSSDLFERRVPLISLLRLHSENLSHNLNIKHLKYLLLTDSWSQGSVKQSEKDPRTAVFMSVARGSPASFLGAGRMSCQFIYFCRRYQFTEPSSRYSFHKWVKKPGHFKSIRLSVFYMNGICYCDSISEDELS